MPIDFFHTLGTNSPSAGLRFFSPQKVLRPMVQSYFVYEVTNDLPLELAFSDGFPTLVFFLTQDYFCFRRQKREVKPEGGYLGGIVLEQTYVVKPAAKVKLLGVRFTPDGLYHVIRQPVHELRGSLGISIERLFGPAGLTLLLQLKDAPLIREKLGLIEHFIGQQLRKKVACNHRLAEAVYAIRENRGSVNILKLAQDMNVNVKWLERKFLRYVGMTPKEYARTIRFLQAHVDLVSSQGTDLMKVAVNNGYYDQSHFIRAFKRFTGKSPLSYLEGFTVSI